MIGALIPTAIAGLLLAAIHSLGKPAAATAVTASAGAPSGAQASQPLQDQGSGGASYQQQNSPYDLTGLFGAPPVSTLQSNFGSNYGGGSSVSQAGTPSQTAALTPQLSPPQTVFSPAAQTVIASGGPAFDVLGGRAFGTPAPPTLYQPGAIVAAGHPAVA